MKTAVVLFNIGGPDQPESIKPFLTNFFSDPNIIQLPGVLRQFVARRIANKRSQGEALDAYQHMGGKSPLLENTQAQADALEQELRKTHENTKVFVCMRYWHPMSAQVVRQVKDYAPDRVFLLPLYPQFSTTTTRSSLEDWARSAKQAGLEASTTEVCCYPFQDGFISASADLVRDTYKEAQAKNPDTKFRVLFSAHGLPEKIIKGGDPYQWQCEETAAKIVGALDIPGLDWQVCYQSRVGPLKWIEPSTDQALEKAAEDNVGVLIYPHAFVSEHVETLVEIEYEYRAMAQKLGIPGFYRVPTVSTHPKFIKGLAALILDRVKGDSQAHQLCPADYQQCCKKAA